MQQFAIYDMDKTITRRPTWTPFLIGAAAARAPWRLVLLPVAGLLSLGYLMRLVSRARLKERTQALLIGRRVTQEAIAPIAARFADRLVAQGFYPGALERIAADRAAGRRVVIATASYRFYAETIAARLGIEDVVATESMHDAEGRILARIDGQNCYGTAKLAMIKAWLGRQGLDRSQVQVRFYSDHVSDAPTLDWADEAFAVNPHGPLRAMARARQWEVIDWED